VISIPCPHCGPRNSIEFRHAGDGHPRPDPATTTPAEWRAYLYMRQNARGWTRESWYHAAGCRKFFQLERNTDTEEVRPAEPTPAEADRT
jgi:sarcosine oxidase, subunit delta